jgi:hypothetical protein
MQVSKGYGLRARVQKRRGAGRLQFIFHVFFSLSNYLTACLVNVHVKGVKGIILCLTKN